jgi:hypothetical protein
VVENPASELQNQDTELLDVNSVNSLLSDADQMQKFTLPETSEIESQQAIQGEDVQDIALLEIDQPGQSLALQEKSELVASTAQSMGIELQLSEVENIASHIEYSGDSLDEGINDIQSAITAFIEYKAQVNQQKIDNMIDEVRQVVNARNANTSQHLNNGLNQIAKDIKQANSDFKSSVKTALKCFSIPTIKAG